MTDAHDKIKAPNPNWWTAETQPKRSKGKIAADPIPTSSTELAVIEPDSDDETEPAAVDELSETGKTKKRVPKGKAKYIKNPHGSTVILPLDKLSTKSEQKALIQRVNTMTNAVAALAQSFTELHNKYQSLRMTRQIDTTEIAALARKGLGKHAIATLLGFETNMFSTRTDLEEAFNIGRSELAVAISDRQIELMMTTKSPILPIFLGKNYLGQKDTPDTQVNVNVQVNLDFKEQLKKKLMTATVVDAEFTEVKTAQQEKDSATETDGSNSPIPTNS